MRRYLVLAGSLVMLLACKNEEPVKPLPPRELMVDILVDLHLAEGPMARVIHDERDSIGLILRSKIADKYEMTPEDLEDIISRLQQKPEESIPVYDSVMVRLTKLQRSNMKE